MVANLDFYKFLHEITEWQRKNFPEAKPYQPLLGLVEEVSELADTTLPSLQSAIGRLSHHHLKMEQEIRGSFAEHFQAKKDAVGDIFIFLVHYCTLNGFHITEALMETWAVVRERNWKENPLTGRTDNPLNVPFNRGSISEMVRELPLTVDETL